MNVTLVSGSPAEVSADAVVVGYYAEEPVDGPLAEVDRATNGTIAKWIAEKEITGKPSELTTVLAPPGFKTSRLTILGLGSREQFNRGTAFRSTAAAAKAIA